MQNYVLRNITVVNEGKIEQNDLYLKNGRIERIGTNLGIRERVEEIRGEGLHAFPGVIDDQVHFREPGLTHKATIYSESRAAVAGGVTSFMEMPNTIPNALTQDILEDKYRVASRTSMANYSFYMGVSNTNAEEVLKVNRRKKEICGVKIFMGASTGNMLVDDARTLETIFGGSELLIATHCEDEKIIRANYARQKEVKPELEPADHPVIRNAEACYSSSSFAASLAKKHGTRLHILHITTAKELELFTNEIPLSAKKITSEVCVHHLHFTAADYDRLGYLIKCNPAIKEGSNREALWEGLLDDRLDVIATDHAPHTIDEKEGPYEHAHAGLPLVQHPLLLMLEYYMQGRITLEKIASKMSHAVADCFLIADRGYIREGYFADLAIVDLNAGTKVTKENLYYQCGWSPLEGVQFGASVVKTFVGGHCAYDPRRNYGKSPFDESQKGHRLSFTR